MMDKLLIFGLLLFVVVGCTSNVAGEAQYAPVEEVYSTCNNNKCDAGDALECPQECTVDTPVKTVVTTVEPVVHPIVYAATDNSVRAIENGNKKWERELAVTSNVVHGNQQVFVGTTSVISLSEETGLQQWAYDTKKVVTGLTFHDNIVYAIAENALYAIDTVTGNLIWNYNVGQGLKEEYTTLPVVHDNHVYAQTRYTAKVDMQGKEVWNLETQIPYGAQLVVADYTYVPSGPELLVVHDGEVLYTIEGDRAPNKVGHQPCQEVGAVFVDDHVHVLWTEYGPHQYCHTEFVTYKDGTEIDSVSVTDITGTSQRLTDASHIVTDDATIMFTVSDNDASYLITGSVNKLASKTIKHTQGLIVHDNGLYIAHSNGDVSKHGEWEYSSIPSNVPGLPAVN